MRQLVHLLSCDNNLVPFHLWWRKIVWKSEKVYKYFVQGCRIIKVVLKVDFLNKMQLNFLKISFSSKLNNLKRNMYVNSSFTCIRFLKVSILFTLRTVSDPASSFRDFYYYCKTRRHNVESFTITHGKKSILYYLDTLLKFDSLHWSADLVRLSSNPWVKKD